MASKALVTWRGGARNRAALAREAAVARSMGLTIESETANGTLVRGSDEQYRSLEAQGLRVKVLPDTNLLRIGRYTIDIEAVTPDVPAALDVAAASASEWPHQLVQLAGPPTDDWVRAIEAQGVEVVEPVSGYGLFVYASGRDVEALRRLPFVVWTGPLKPAYRIHGSGGLEPHYLFIGVYPSSEATRVRAALTEAHARILEEGTQPAAYGGEYATFKAQGVAVETVAAIPHVRWVEAVPRMSPLGERETQIVAENLDGAAPPNTAPITGYQTWLSTVGVNGSGVIVAIVDSGVDANASNNDPVAHSDLRGRQTAFIDYSGGLGLTDTNGHGTNVAGIALGNAASGQVEAAAPGDFLWGQGVAPGASFVTQNFLDGNIAEQPTVDVLIQDSAVNHAQVMNNSWGIPNSGGDGYDALARTMDLGVRDANPATAALEPVAIVCAAGNAGGRPQSIASPHESKNDIIVGNCLTARPDVGFPSEDIRGIAGTSSRGPAVDGRILPTVVAPGTDVPAAFSSTALFTAPIPGTGVPDPANAGQLIDRYTFMTGTSQACPHVSGACAMLIEWWRNRSGGRNPSPAMLKALIVNGAEDLAGGANWRTLNGVAADAEQWSAHTSPNIFRRTLSFVPSTLVEGVTSLTQVANVDAINAVGRWAFDASTNTIFVRMRNDTDPAGHFVPFLTALDSAPLGHLPNHDQGWGRVSLSNMLLQSPVSDRGPAIYSDQKHAFVSAGQEFQITVAPVDTARPMRITLVWTDVPGAAGANPALVNDLDLEVTELATGTVFKGNVFNDGFSAAGGIFDNLNTVECVFLQSPSGVYEVRVIAAVIAASANPAIATPWQDFALVIDNADVPAAEPVNVSVVLDRSASMSFLEYVDITRITSRQSVDLMQIGDAVGVASFGSTAFVHFPPGGSAVQEITGQPVKDAATAQIDGIAFDGCTFMGGGIEAGGNLLSGAAARRAIVLLSDGYDNKGCPPPNSNRPSAVEAANALPEDIRLFSCAMGPQSDQALLESLAAATGGRYYFMPMIDDLFEIYNYIRGQVTGDSIAVNQSATASTSSLPAVIDASAELATFTVAWADPKIRVVAGTPRRQGEMNVRLRDPGGRRIPAHASFVRRQVGEGYVIFRIDDPAPGQWRIEVRTAEGTHVRFTAGVFLRSPLRLVVLHPRHLRLGESIRFGATLLDGRRQFVEARARTVVSAPSLGLRQWAKKFRRELDRIDPPKVPDGDSLPDDVARLTVPEGAALGKELLARVQSRVHLTRGQLDPALFPESEDGLDAREPVLAGSVSDATQQGSYNVTVTVSGTAPRSGSRFVRKDLVSVLVQE